MKRLINIALIHVFLFCAIYCESNDNVLVYTVATEETNGFQRYAHSAKAYDIEPIILGFGQKWKGGDDIKQNPGGGWKVNLLKEALKLLKNEQNTIVLFTDSYDVMFLNNLEEIVKKFKSFDAKILFSAETFCWPDDTLVSEYPEVKDGKRFLNSGLYIGYLPEMLELLERAEIQDTDDDQLFFTKAFLDKEFREKVQFKLDHRSELFQNLNGASTEVEIIETEGKEAPETYKLTNTFYHTEPLIIHANGFSKTILNSLGNYLSNSWNSKDGCLHCKLGQIDLDQIPAEQTPKVLVAYFIEYPTPFLEEQLLKMQALEYPKNKIDLFIHNTAKYHVEGLKEFVETYGKEYNSVKQILPDDGITEWAARDLSLDHCVAKKCDYYFSLDSVVHLDNPHTLKLLIEQNRSVVAPLLVRPSKAWSNFWGALTKDGFYARSNDYMDIVHNDKRGLWNVPFVGNSYLINGTILRRFDRKILNFSTETVDADMAFCRHLRILDVFMFVTNRVDFGHLINPETFDVTRSEPEMYQIFDNEKDWEERYIHEDYPDNLNSNITPKQPCQDVYWFPIVTKRFCTSLIKMMEDFGKWSEGKNQDNRLEGGYEAVPTRDIHMNQVGWEPHWLHFLKTYVRPLQEHVFLGYSHDPPKSLMNFVVRYRPDEQPSLRPHHDSSTYTINVALNEADVDYEGGGCRFIRYNCSVTKTKVGWLLMHPGRLTHFHEGLLVTKGTRYIMISFVDP